MSFTTFNLDTDVTIADSQFTTNFTIDSATAAQARNITSFVTENISAGFLTNAQGGTTTTPLSAAFRHIANYYFSSSADAAIPLSHDNTTTTGIARVLQIGRTTADDGVLSGSMTAIMSIDNVSDLTFIDVPESAISSSIGRKGNIVQQDDTSNVVGTIFYDTGTLIFHGGDSSTNFTTDAVSGFVFGPGATSSTIAINSFSFKSLNKIQRTSFFCRALNKDYNYTNNITSLKDSSLGTITGSLTAFPTTFITTVGLYNDDGDLLALAKVSPPVKKNFDIEKTFSVRLQY
jgi:hypothetical protein